MKRLFLENLFTNKNSRFILFYGVFLEAIISVIIVIYAVWDFFTLKRSKDDFQIKIDEMFRIHKDDKKKVK